MTVCWVPGVSGPPPSPVSQRHFILRFFRGILHQLGILSPPNPAVLTVRHRPHSRAAIVFIHGFAGHTAQTWGRFPEFLERDVHLQNWDIFTLGYPSSIRIDVVGLWEADPELTLASLSLKSVLSIPPLKQYESLALVAHSMGGLIVQHALLDRATASRVGHVVLYGTPSNGLAKASLGARLKRQARDMSLGSEFLTSLRSQWTATYGQSLPFTLRVVAGVSDVFVPSASAFSPFPREICRAIPGNHLEIVKPLLPTDPSVEILVDALTGTRPASVIDSAMVAAELRQFTRVIETLLPYAQEIDDAGLVELALALDGMGRETEALRLLEQRCAKNASASADALGVLAGRLKRRWLTERSRGDWERARALYLRALELVVSHALGIDPTDGTLHNRVSDPGQAMYHAINIAFLELMITPTSAEVPPSATAMASRALEFASKAKDNHWRDATIAEARLLLGNLQAAREAYAVARSKADRPRDVYSMYVQGLLVAERVFGQKGVRAIEETFREIVTGTS